MIQTMKYRQPNILFLMTDQMQGRVLEDGHPCQTPHFDQLAAKGVRFPRAYTPNAVCSPARASLMTGLLPHSHGVLEVIHTVDGDQCNLRTEHPHWAQRLQSAGYRTGYFGKWHVERSNDLRQFGWLVNGSIQTSMYREQQRVLGTVQKDQGSLILQKTDDYPPGFSSTLLYGVTNISPEQRGLCATTDLARNFLQQVISDDSPWCCFVSLTEPHDPFVTGEAAFSQYEVDAIPLQPTVHNKLTDQPNLYRKAGRTWQGMNDRQRREAAACYYASITEIDEQFGTLIDMVNVAGQRENTIIVLTSDHGELLGSHGLYCKNISGFEEVYQIPLVISGPEVGEGIVSSARVGLHDIAPTLLELAGLPPIGMPDSKSFSSVLSNEKNACEYAHGFAEYHGGRYRLTQRVIWDGSWKLVWNGFDYDELYNIDIDPYEMNNLIHAPDQHERIAALMAYAWRVIRDTGDHALLNSDYPILRLAPVGPKILDE